MDGLILEDAVTSFSGTAGIGPVSLRLEKGRMMALLGASGSGKTTILRMIAGLALVESGRISFDRRALDPLPPSRRRVGMVFQNYGLFPHMDVRRNISFGLRMAGLNHDNIQSKLDWILDKTRLTGLEGRFASQLSGGQKQRVALARTLVMDPDILLLDEPLSNLDSNLRDEMAAFIRNLQQEFGITTVFVTHDQNEALMLADQVAVVIDGRIVQQGTAEEIYETPRSLPVAKFMGAVNLLPGVVLTEKSVRCALGDIPVPALRQARSGERLTLMIRPQYLHFIDACENVEGRDHVIRGNVEAVRYHGDHLTYDVRAGESLLTVSSNCQQRYTAGSPVRLASDPDHIWTLPPGSQA
jgi:ABC-type Fe3+/spermidine/putrescine transport system ATPase subunit